MRTLKQGKTLAFLEMNLYDEHTNTLVSHAPLVLPHCSPPPLVLTREECCSGRWRWASTSSTCRWTGR